MASLLRSSGLAVLGRVRASLASTSDIGGRLVSTTSSSGATTSIDSIVPETPSTNNPPMAPWTPTDQLKKRKTLMKRMEFMIRELEKEQVAAALNTRPIPQFKPGDVLEVLTVVPENKRRVTAFRGVCISQRRKAIRSTFTLRNYLGTAGAVERTFPLHSPQIQEIRVVEERKARRAKLFYLRERAPKVYRV
uniref:50S ribosomal protein L19 n=1 Tax=Helicosporidium sp. subsp. Simulium jonesii TaxID=145475 RepID=Q5YBB0_HELSJ|nr:50S ribosomal protein L19 [Helicosporidium sp. ex Simulium jonesi]